MTSSSRVAEKERTVEVLQLDKLNSIAALLENLPIGSKVAVLPKPRLKNPSLNCFTYGENKREPYDDDLYLFRALALHLHGNQRLDEKTSKIFNSFKIEWTDSVPISSKESTRTLF